MNVRSPGVARLIVVLVFLCAAASGQSTLYRVSGKVVSASNGQVVPHASLTLGSVTKPDPTTARSTTSDADGSFAFEDVPAGKYDLRGGAPGFVSTAYDEHAGFSTAIVTGSTVSAESLVLKLRPRATLSGTISDASGEPVTPATVLLFRQAEDFGDGPIQPAGTAPTNDVGQYQFPDLPAGSYLLAVEAQPWYAAAPHSGQSAGTVGITGPVDPNLNVAYPITYYPGVTDRSQATPIQLDSGDATADVRMVAVPAVQLLFRNAVSTRVDPRTGRPVTMATRVPQLQVEIFGTEQFMPTTVEFNGPDAVLGGLAPGSYILAGTSGNGQTNTRRRLTASNTGSADIAADESLIDVKFSLHLPDGSPAGANYQLLLSQDGDHQPFPAAVTGPKGQAEFALAPGDYYVQVVGGGPPAEPMFVRQLLVAGRPVAFNPLHVDAQSASAAALSYTATVVPGNITIDGFAEKDGHPCPGAFVLLVPADELQHPHNWRTQQTDLDGSFELSAVAPGKYLLFVIEEGWTLNWHDGSVLERYVPAATAVQVEDSPSDHYGLSHPIPVQTKQ